ncbi:helicase associated domain-containing protein [Kitasatospora sp. NPDC048722]|uniref:helicase associated domain-containing protein n=1 Tax=Kitasatospora sp. NPDC048722 TaxID=3155639 RepID=UPI0033C7F342
MTDAALSHARAYAAAHFHLALRSDEQHDGFPLGAWLNNQRAHEGHRTCTTGLHQELTGLDPWWNPPWLFRWQLTYQQARIAHAQGRPLPWGIRAAPISPRYSARTGPTRPVGRAGAEARSLSRPWRPSARPGHTARRTNGPSVCLRGTGPRRRRRGRDTGR